MADKTYRAVIAVGNSLEEKVPDRKGIGQRDYLVRNFGLSIDSLTISKLWLTEVELKENEKMSGRKSGSAGEKEVNLLCRIAEGILANPVVHSYCIFENLNPFESRKFNSDYIGSWVLRFGFKTEPFVSDVEGEYVKKAIQEVLGIKLASLRAATQYTLKGKLNIKDLELIASQSPIDPKCHKVIYFPFKMDTEKEMQSPMGNEYCGTVIVGISNIRYGRK